MNEVALRAQSLVKQFGATTVVDDVSFDVPYGEVTALLGPNGAGKTTTMRMMVGLLRPTSGDTLLDGGLLRDTASLRRVLGVVTNQLGAHPGHTAALHLRTITREAGLDPRRVTEVLELVGLAEVAAKRVSTFSTGMRQRLALAAALLGRPRILVLDEPASGLDAPATLWLRDLLAQQARDGVAVLLSTHQIADFRPIFEGVVSLTAGRVERAARAGIES